MISYTRKWQLSETVKIRGKAALKIHCMTSFQTKFGIYKELGLNMLWILKYIYNTNFSEKMYNKKLLVFTWQRNISFLFSFSRDIFMRPIFCSLFEIFWYLHKYRHILTSSNGNFFQFMLLAGLRWIPRTKACQRDCIQSLWASDSELWCFLWSAPE